MEGVDDAAGGPSNLLRRGAHHVRRGLSRAGVPQIAGHAARLGGHGWRRISSAVSQANSGGRITRPASALWGRVARRPSDPNRSAGDAPQGHRNRRLAFDFAVFAAGLAIVLMLHHQFRQHRGTHRPRIAEALAATSNAAPDPASQGPSPAPAPHHRRRRTHTPAPLANGPEAHPSDIRSGDPVALAADRKDSDHGADFGDHPDAGHKADHRDLPPVEVVKTATRDLPPPDSKRAADASLDSLLAAPGDSGAPHHVDSGAPRHSEPAAPVAQTEPPPSHDLDRPAHPHRSDDPLLVDSRNPGDSALPPSREHFKHSDASGSPPADEFAAPETGKPHEHHEPKDHRPKDAGPNDGGPKDEFSVPAPAPASSEPADSLPPKTDSLAPKDDAHHHQHHHPDHGPGDQAAGGDLAATPADKDTDLLAPKLDAPLPDSGHSTHGTAANSCPAPKPSHGPSDAPPGNDPLLDVGPKLDGPQKDAPADPPLKSSGDKLATHKPDHADDALPVLSMPSPHKNDDLPTRTANASDAPLGGSPGDLGKNPPVKPETKTAAGGDAGLDDLLNSKAPSSGPSGPSAASEPKPSASSASPGPNGPPASDSKTDPFHTDVTPHADGAPHHDTAPKPDTGAKLDTAPKQAEPSPAESSLPPVKSNAEPLHSAADDELMPSVAVAHHQIEKDETGASIRYKIVVRNNGKKAVKSFEVDEAVPAEHTVQVTDPPAETRDQDLHWTLRDVGPGEERTIVVTLAPPARPAEHQPEHLQPIAEPAAATQPIPAAPAARAAAKAETPQLKLELITPGEVHAGESCRIGFRATNLGVLTSDLKVNLDLPDQLHYTRGQQLQYKIGALGDHEAREDYLTATAAGTGQVELRAEILQAGHSVATAKGTCHVAPAGAPHRGIQQTGASTTRPSGPTQSADGSNCLCWP